MAIAQTSNILLSFSDGFSLPSTGDHWDGYAGTTPIQFTDGVFQGYMLDWGSYDNQNVNSPFFNQPYAGYNSNWGGVTSDNMVDSFKNELYTGYNTNWGKYEQPIEESLFDIDINSVIDHPKDQTIYYKLKGWNPLTSSWEAWVISENITGRPELFDPVPGRHPANVERDVFKTPPSGNNLVNIVIVSRWIE